MLNWLKVDVRISPHLELTAYSRSAIFLHVKIDGL
jgi:hypothetical protein